jgi:hypothetical protein
MNLAFGATRKGTDGARRAPGPVVTRIASVLVNGLILVAANDYGRTH